MKEDIIEKIGKKIPYSVPEEYLENFTSEMMNQYKVFKPRYRFTNFVKYAAAAIIIIAAVPGYFILKNSDKPDNFMTQQDVKADNELSKSIEQLSDDELNLLTSVLESDIYKDQN